MALAPTGRDTATSMWRRRTEVGNSGVRVDDCPCAIWRFNLLLWRAGIEMRCPLHCFSVRFHRRWPRKQPASALILTEVSRSADDDNERRSANN